MVFCYSSPLLFTKHAKYTPSHDICFFLLLCWECFLIQSSVSPSSVCSNVMFSVGFSLVIYLELQSPPYRISLYLLSPLPSSHSM